VGGRKRWYGPIQESEVTARKVGKFGLKGDDLGRGETRPLGKNKQESTITRDGELGVVARRIQQSTRSRKRTVRLKRITKNKSLLLIVKTSQNKWSGSFCDRERVG